LTIVDHKLTIIKGRLCRYQKEDIPKPEEEKEEPIGS
jgi:hypothetical protein